MLISHLRHLLDVRSVSGDEATAICPWHQDTRPSLRVNTRTGRFLCHACGKKGRDILQELGHGPHVPEPGSLMDRVRRLSETPEEPWLDDGWLRRFWGPRDYWRSRGITDASIDAWGLGWDLDRDCGIIPIRDLHGRLLGVIRRQMTGQPKYRYPQGLKVSRHLWGAWRAKGCTHLAVCEGPLDAVMLWQAGIPAVALFGAQISTEQVGVLQEMGVLSVVLMLDNDPAGRAATQRVADVLRWHVVVRVADTEHLAGKDPGEWTAYEAREGWLNARYLLEPGLE